MFTDLNGLVFNDQTGTNFGAVTQGAIDQNLPYEQGAVYAWSLNDFDTPYDSWVSGQKITVASGASPDVVIFKALTNPYLANDVEMTATGKVSDTSGNTVNFDKSTVKTEEYWEIKDTDGHLHWFAKVTDGTNSMLITSKNFAATGNSFELNNVDTSPGHRTTDPNDFETIWDKSSGAANVTDPNINSAYFPRIDMADSPLSPAHLGAKEDGSDTSWLNNLEGDYAVYKYDALTFTAATGGGFDVSVVSDGAPYSGKFYTRDNDQYFHDGSATYDSDINDRDQIGRAEFADGTKIDPQLFQAENSFAVTFTNSEGNEVTSEIARLSFGGTNSSQYVWLVSKNFEFGASSYKYAYSDGSPGFDNNYDIDKEMAFQYTDLLICFVAGTGIETMDGIVSVEDIRAGDFVLTKDNGYQPVRWIGSSKIDAKRIQDDPMLLPVKISAGALSAKVPSADLFVSRQHRMLLGSKIVERMFDQEEVLVKAKDLVGIIPGVEFVEVSGALEGDVEYFHILFDQHEVLFANGALAESFYLGDHSMSALDEEARAEIAKIFPEVNSPEFEYSMVRALVTGPRARQCLKRHANTQKELVLEN